MKLSMNQQCACTTNNLNYILGFIRKITADKAEVIHHKVLIKSQLEIYVYFLVTTVQE